MSMQFSSLPPTVVEYVLSCLAGDRTTQLRCRRVCREINTALFSPSLSYMWKNMEFTQNGSTLSTTEQTKVRGFLAFLSHVSGCVETLKFRATFPVSVTHLNWIPILPQLRTLDLSKNNWLLAQHLLQFAQKCDIRHVNLRDCRSLPTSAFAVLSKNWTNLESINLSNCFALSDSSGKMTQFHRSLTALKRYCFENEPHHSVNDETIFSLLDHHGATGRLTELRVYAEYLTDASFSAIGSCVNLEIFTAVYCRNLTDTALLAVKGLTALKHLHLTYGDHFSTDGLVQLFKDASFQLKHLCLSNISALDDKAMEHIFDRNPGLQSLGLRCTNRVTYVGIAGAKQLLDLSLLGCSSLNRVNAQLFSSELLSLPWLRFLNLRRCNHITQADVDTIRNTHGELMVCYDDWDTTDFERCQTQLAEMDGLCCVHV